MYIRFSTEDDKEDIYELMMLCFGDMNHCGVLENLNGRYLLTFDSETGKLIAMTGLLWSEEYKAYEVDWTCTHPQYQKTGVMHELFRRICSLTDEDIYCSCWRLPDKPHVNLYSLMKDFGFEEVVRCRVTWDSEHNCQSGRGNGFCVAQRSHVEQGVCLREHCKCYEDLWLRRAKCNI